MLRLIHQCEDTIRSKLSESNSETCSRDFSFDEPQLFYTILYATRNAAVVSINCSDLFFHEFYMPFLHVLNNGSRNKRKTVASATETRL